MFCSLKKTPDICRQCLFVHKKIGLYLRNSCAVDSPIRFKEQNNVVTNKNKISDAIFCLQQLKCKKKTKNHNHCHPWNLTLLIFLLLKLRSPYESVYKHMAYKKKLNMNAVKKTRVGDTHLHVFFPLCWTVKWLLYLPFWLLCIHV